MFTIADEDALERAVTTLMSAVESGTAGTSQSARPTALRPGTIPGVSEVGDWLENATEYRAARSLRGDGRE